MVSKRNKRQKISRVYINKTVNHSLKKFTDSARGRIFRSVERGATKHDVVSIWRKIQNVLLKTHPSARRNQANGPIFKKPSRYSPGGALGVPGG
jgi:hypothetical protein